MPTDPALDATGSPPATDEAVDAQSIRLMRRVKEGDERAFRELVDLHRHAVIGTCTRMLGNAADAHDVAQLVFLRIWKAAPRYEPSAKFTTWMFTILRNLVFNETRRRSRKPTVSLDEPLGGDGEGAASRDVADPAAPTPAEARLRMELEEAIDAAISRLPEQQRLAVVLRRYEDMAYEDIAAALGTTVPAVKSLLFRARTQLRELLAPYFEE